MHYVYLLENQHDKSGYIGYTSDPDHKQGYTTVNSELERNAITIASSL